MDLFLSGGKTHDSEIRLCRYLIQQLEAGDCFCDVGAHVGYFSLLAKQLIGASGKVIAVEASPVTYELLEINCRNKHIETHQMALSEHTGQLDFYVFPALYAEYNSVDIAQYKGKDWFEANPPTLHHIPCSTLNHLLQHINERCFVKIDVEGHKA
jgi:FkbM family methyltransferase